MSRTQQEERKEPIIAAVDVPGHPERFTTRTSSMSSKFQTPSNSSEQEQDTSMKIEQPLVEGPHLALDCLPPARRGRSHAPREGVDHAVRLIPSCGIDSTIPLTPTLSPLHGARGQQGAAALELFPRPACGERARVRGRRSPIISAIRYNKALRHLNCSLAPLAGGARIRGHPSCRSDRTAAALANPTGAGRQSVPSMQLPDPSVAQQKMGVWILYGRA